MTFRYFCFESHYSSLSYFEKTFALILKKTRGVGSTAVRRKLNNMIKKHMLEINFKSNIQ